MDLTCYQTLLLLCLELLVFYDHRECQIRNNAKIIDRECQLGLLEMSSWSASHTPVTQTRINEVCFFSVNGQ